MRLKPPHTQLLLLRKLLPLFGGLLSLGTSAQTAPPANALPTGGQVSAGQASISQNGANMLIQQGSNRAAINWQSFNVGSNAQVQFQQPSASSVTLNRVMSADPSKIFGRITANGQVILTNPQGVYFGKDARVDVGGIIATTHGISDADFMAGKTRFERNGSTGSVVNEGELKAGLGGYIALLAPEVRNQGAIIAQMGTVALAAGEAVDLHFDSNNRLTSIRVEPSQIQALVDNRHAVQAPGGLIVLSAQSMDRLVGGVVRNSGRIEANGLQQQGGRIVLSASHKVENTGNISAKASVGMAAGDSGPTGKIEISAPEVVNSGSISANGAGQYAAGTVRIEGGRVEQTASGSVRAEAAVLGGRIEISASENAHLEGVLSVAASVTTAETTATELGTGGIIDIEAAQITLSDVVLDASGLGGGTIRLHASGGDAAPAAPEQPSDPRVPGRLAILGNGAISVRGRSARGGLATLTGDDISLLDNTSIDATGATGGGKVLVGGDWQGSNDVYQATTVLMKSGATIDASATDNGDGGTVVLWSDIRSPHSVTTASGVIYANGGVNGGDGGKIETSGGLLVTEGVTGSAAAPLGRAGEWLFDPTNVTIGTSGVAVSQNNGTSISASSIASLLNGGTSVTVTTYSGGGDLGDLTVNSAISKSSGAEVTLTLRAANSIVINQSISHSGGERLNLLIDADNDTAASTAGASPARNGGGIVILEASLSTGGGGVTFGGTVNGVYTGGDLFVGGSNAVAISTAGGAVDVKGNLIIANSSTEGFTINTAGGAIDLRQAVDSGNQYTMESGSRSWEQAFTDAKDNGGWLATIGSSLENALAIRAAGYSSAWLGGQRIIGTNEWRWTADPNYNASTNPMTFFYQGAATEQTLGGTSLGAGGKTAAGYFANWSGWTDGQIGSSEPNNWNGSAPAPFSEDRESALQFTGSQGLWNDLSRTNTSLDRYVLETNLAPSRLNLNAGVGAVNIGAGVGFSKPLATLNVTSSSSTVNGNGLVTTGAQTYSSALTVNAPNSTQDVRLSAGDSGITAAGRISIYGASIAPESSLNSTASGAGLLLQATGNIDIGPSDISFTTNNGAVSVLADSDANGSGQIWLGKVTVNPGSGNVISRGEIIDPEFATINGTGTVTLESSDVSFGSAFNTNRVNLASTLTGLTVGKSTNTQDVTVGAALSIAGPISIYGGNIALNAALTANGENTITLKGSGSITQTAALSATNLLLLGGNVTLTNASNAVETLAASGVSSLSYIDSNALTLGTVDTTNGISASGAVSIGTQSLGLTVAQNLTTTDATSSALTLNAGIDTVAGTGTGGNIIISGSPTISVGSGGIAKLYTGSVSGSTGLTALVGSGSGRFRYNSDEAAANYTSALVSGLYSIYREQPAATVTVNASTMTYGDTLPVLGSATSLVNGDTASFEITGRTNASSGNINYKSSAYAVTNTNLAALGYNVTVATPGTLTVNQKSLTLSGLTASDKTYDTNTIATLTGTAAVTALGSDVVTLGGTALGTFADKSAADGKAVTVTGVTLSGTGADNGNYILLQQTGLTASIGKANLSVTGLTASDKTYDTNTIATLTGTAAATALSSDVVTLGGTAAGTFADKDVGTAKAVIVTGVTLSGTGADNGNYILLQQTGLSANISAKTVTLSASKTYDGTTNLTGFVNLGGLVGSETLTYSGATSNDAHVATGSKFISTMTLANAVDGSGGLASNYQLPTLDVAYAPVTINAKALTSTASIGGTLTKTFSGTKAATGASVSGTVNGAVSGDALTLNTSALALNYNTAHVVGSSTIAASGTAGFTIDASSANSVASDYSFTGPTIANVSGTINAKALTATASIGGTLSKVYDGVSDAPGAGLSGTVSGAVDGDMLTLNTAPVSLSYNRAHVVGGNKIEASGSAGFTIAGSTAGSLSSDYSFTAPSIADVTASITAKAITLTAPTTTKVYDGQTTYVASAADLAALSAALGVSGDSVSGISLTYDDKNVGTSKTLAASHAAIADGNSGGNYTISYTSNTQSSISRRSSVTWVGGASGNWFDPANWAAGAVPDLSNVANVVIPSGVTVSFGGTVVSPAQGGAVNLDGLTGAGGNLSHSDGTLNVGTGGITLGSLTQSGGVLTNMGSTTLVNYTQSGGSYTGTGPMTVGEFAQTGGTTLLSDALTVTQDFSQGSLGNVTVGGNTRLTDTNGGAQLGNLNSTGVLTVNSTDGAITQAPATVITTQSISSFLAAQGGSTADIALSNMGNDFHAAVGLNGRNVAINDTNALALGIASTTGNLTLTSNGALNLGTSTVGGNASANSGNGDITQSGAFRVGGATTLLAGTGAVNLFDPGNLLAQGVTVVASSSNIVGDSRKSAGTAEEKVQGSLPSTTLPGFGVPTAAAPAPLVLTQNVANTATADSAGSGNQASAGGGNNAGITIDLREAPISSASIMAAVSLPMGTATAGTGFSFELPESIRDLMGNGESAQLSLPDGRDLPAWLRFNAQTLSFEAAAVPNGAFPLQLALSIGGQRVMVVISERVE